MQKENSLRIQPLCNSLEKKILNLTTLLEMHQGSDPEQIHDLLPEQELRIETFNKWPLKTSVQLLQGQAEVFGNEMSGWITLCHSP